MEGISVVEFQKEFPVLNLELSKNEKDFERGIIAIHVAELEKGFIVKKINKTTKNSCDKEFQTRALVNVNKQRECMYFIKKVIENTERC